MTLRRGEADILPYTQHTTHNTQHTQHTDAYAYTHTHTHTTPGRINSKRVSGQSLIFYDLRADDAKVQVMADRKTAEDDFAIHTMLRRGRCCYAACLTCGKKINMKKRETGGKEKRRRVNK